MSCSPYKAYDYENYQEKYCNQPMQIRNLLYGLIGDESCDILSIGCGNGYIEEVLVRKGHRAYGFDLSEKACALASEKGIQCEQVDFLALDTDQYERKFDWIIAIDVWEHIIEAGLFLHQVANCLKDDGRFFLKSPNFGHIKFRYRYLKNGSLNTPYQLSVGHYAHYTYRETIDCIRTSPLRIDQRYCFTYNPVPFTFKYRDWLFPNLTSLSTILVLAKR